MTVVRLEDGSTYATSANVPWEIARWEAAARRVEEAQAAVDEAVRGLADFTPGRNAQAVLDAYDAAEAALAAAYRAYFHAGEDARAMR